MSKVLSALVGMSTLSLVGLANAAEPVTLTEAQMVQSDQSQADEGQKKERELEARRNRARQLGQTQPYEGCGYKFFCDPVYHLACEKTPGHGGPPAGAVSGCP